MNIDQIISNLKVYLAEYKACTYLNPHKQRVGLSWPSSICLALACLDTSLLEVENTGRHAINQSTLTKHRPCIHASFHRIQTPFVYSSHSSSHHDIVHPSPLPFHLRPPSTAHTRSKCAPDLLRLPPSTHYLFYQASPTDPRGSLPPIAHLNRAPDLLRPPQSVNSLDLHRARHAAQSGIVHLLLPEPRAERIYPLLRLADLFHPVCVQPAAGAAVRGRSRRSERWAAGFGS